ncbi:LacI family DNA-binding transcriptional regulator [Arthrobacter sp. ISL-65]|uniref:LacI family DNA-binding transcriptional regulator n=1 Tax=Arthrobacter sp. ISL-65 TaxID=2819112 RepID=UPI001BEA6DE9|nr:LacI family DNA-binding transcriptional regulator [Arthrobacter sp. ISL-65]MBT2551003.1 LacI family DNA-binding transcriptional regulator [Arthrobacter sp. ISL-65]
MTEPRTQGHAALTGAAKKQARNGKSHATIYDIAKVAGVNPSTVSRALSKPERVSAKTRKLIEDAAAQLDYQVNPFARALPTGRTNTFGLIVADITNPTFFDIIRGAETTATLRDYTLLLAESAESPVTELTAARRMMATADGLILASPRMDDDDIRALAKDKPVVVINREVDGVPCVIPDVGKGISEAVRSLAGNGHKKLAFVAGPPRSWMSARRWEGVQAACDWSKLEAVRLESSKPTVDGGRQVAREVRASGATAVLTYNDLLAIGLMQELQAAGMVVPDQISIVGFDDIFGADFTTPPLTTVRSPLGECGAGATARLLDLLSGRGEPAGTLRVETELVLRGSSGRLLPLH